MIRLSRPSIGSEEELAVTAVLRTGMLVQGPIVADFEAELASQTGRAHAVATANGTSALELALVASGIGPGDEVLVPALTWPSPAHAVLRSGAVPRLVDVHPSEWNATGESLSAARTEQTKAAIVIDQFGNPARWDEIERALPGVTLIEDAACALGSELAGRPCGSFGVISCLSFHPRKVITIGEGGACLTDDEALAERLRALRNHGQARPGHFTEPAGNHRLTDIAAAIGRVQVTKLSSIVDRHRERAARYREELTGLELQATVSTARSNYQTFGALLPAHLAGRRAELIRSMRDRGVEVGLLSYALGELGSLAGLARFGPLPVATEVARRGVALPLYADLTDDDQRAVIECVHASLSELER